MEAGLQGVVVVEFEDVAVKEAPAEAVDVVDSAELVREWLGANDGVVGLLMVSGLGASDAIACAAFVVR